MCQLFILTEMVLKRSVEKSVNTFNLKKPPNVGVLPDFTLESCQISKVGYKIKIIQKTNKNNINIDEKGKMPGFCS